MNSDHRDNSDSTEPHDAYRLPQYEEGEYPVDSPVERHRIFNIDIPFDPDSVLDSEDYLDMLEAFRLARQDADHGAAGAAGAHLLGAAAVFLRTHKEDLLGAEIGKHLQVDNVLRAVKEVASGQARRRVPRSRNPIRAWRGDQRGTAS